MSSYLSSFSNRLYTALETQYGTPVPITSANRISSVQLTAQQATVPVRRRDKTGSRTFVGLPSGLRTETSFHLRTYLTSWAGSGQPAYGPLFQAVMGAPAQVAAALTVAGISGAQIGTTAAHGLSVGSGVSFGGEIRFVTAVVDQLTFGTNAPFTNPPGIGAQCAPCITYKLATTPPSISIFDYWSPANAISRIISGAAVDLFQLTLNGDFHEFEFSGPASDLIDSNTFSSGMGGMTTFPAEPALATFDTSIVPGHLGQVWLGNTPTRFYSLTMAKVGVNNHVLPRATEFGASKPLGVVPGPRQVDVDFSLLACDDAATADLYRAAKLRTAISAMLQLGTQQGRLMGLYVPAVMPEVPMYEETEMRVQWHFRNCLASGVADDELYIAFA